MTIELDPTNQVQYVMLTYPRRIEPTDVGYEVAVSSDLIVWQTGTNYVQELQATPDGNNLTETWTYGSSQKQPTQLVAATTAGSTLTLTWGYGYSGSALASATTPAMSVELALCFACATCL